MKTMNIYTGYNPYYKHIMNIMNIMLISSPDLFVKVQFLELSKVVVLLLFNILRRPRVASPATSAPMGT